MSQPEWEFVANIGDATPIDYGGAFVFRDTTGVYAPELEVLQEPCDDGPEKWTVHRFSLETCTYENGVLSDNKFHKDHAAWFASEDDLASLASYTGQDVSQLIELFCSDDPMERAFAWQNVGQYWGYDNLDGYPLTLSRIEVLGRYSRHPYTKQAVEVE